MQGGSISAAAAAIMTPVRPSETAPALGHAASAQAAPAHAASGRAALGVGPRLERSRRGVAREPRAVPGWVERLLAIPLPAKLVGANLILLIAGLAAGVAEQGASMSSAPMLATIVSELVLALLVNVALVVLAVRPIDELGITADRVWRGDLDARVPRSLLADRDVARVGRTFNILLDALLADRARTRRLASELINAEERERAAIARELHDSAAQSLAALVMQLSAASRAASNHADVPEHTRSSLDTAQTLATDVLEEIRLLAHTMHPRVLDDLGLVAALRRLARETGAHASVDVSLEALPGAEMIGASPQASVLYRVAQEAVQNALRHARPEHIRLSLANDGDHATLIITDDGRGFDVERELREHRGLGLFTMQERVSLVDGTLDVSSSTADGTTVTASVPLGADTLLQTRNTNDIPTHAR